jgi:hypothetical protein
MASGLHLTLVMREKKLLARSHPRHRGRVPHACPHAAHLKKEAALRNKEMFQNASLPSRILCDC